ncbi:MAG: hypothetical protein UW86_C0001G0006 [Microgenomates group bacterium GW2011_GWA1_Microgenomates_45_10]|nr:MAG: hypothetical protein UW69_C0050G0005 [Microgenomates group bacterium GW2011_GWA2_44_7]KKT77285.1 MAG: hypothetical protein UW73_C0024G0023 [Microgenomates group bacterium GW2011_GWB1_44_8]KKT87453.1 MAG: hypothetical protein UW86_C0001G0006 [Microgenomates group bacterium GW2011_GWA1_Microgenomates_45_10]
MEENPKELSFKTSIFVIGFLIIIVVVLVGGLSFLNDRRQSLVKEQYQVETSTYTVNNRRGLTELFVNVFPDVEDQCYVSTPEFNSCAAKASERKAKIQTLIKDDLKDFSSTMFVKMVSRQELLVMRLSGDVRPINIYPPEKEALVKRLLRGEVPTIPWDFYSGELSTKEIFVPIKDAKGEILGAIVRRVYQ